MSRFFFQHPRKGGGNLEQVISSLKYGSILNLYFFLDAGGQVIVHAVKVELSICDTIEVIEIRRHSNK